MNLAQFGVRGLGFTVRWLLIRLEVLLQSLEFVLFMDFWALLGFRWDL